MTSEELSVIAENLVIGVTEGLKQMGDVAASVIEDIQNIMNNNQKNFEKTVEDLVSKHNVAPEEISFELADNSSDFDNIDYKEDLITFNIKAGDNYYGQALISANTYDACIHEGYTKEVNEIFDDLADTLGDETLANETAKEMSEYKANKVPEEEILKKAGYDDKKVNEITLEDYNEDIKKGDVKALIAEREALRQERKEAYIELNNCVGKKDKNNTLDTIKKLNEKIDGKTAEIKAAQKETKSQTRAYIKGLAKGKMYAGLHAIKNCTSAIKTTTMFIKRGMDVRTALNHLYNSHEMALKKSLAVDHAISTDKIKKLIKERNDLAIKMMKQNDRKDNLKALFTGKRADYSKGFTEKQQDKLAKIQEEIYAEAKKCEDIKKEIVKNNGKLEKKAKDIQADIKNIQADRAAAGRKKDKDLDEIASKINNLANGHNTEINNFTNDGICTRNKQIDKYKEKTGRNLMSDIGKAVKESKQRSEVNTNGAPKKEQKNKDER